MDDFVCDVDGAVGEVGPCLVCHGDLWRGGERCDVEGGNWRGRKELVVEGEGGGIG